MRKHEKDRVWKDRHTTQPGTMRMVEALLAFQGKVETIEGNDEAQREAKRLEEKSQETTWYDRKQARFRPSRMRKNAKRKGIRQNYQEQRTIARIK